MPGRRWSEGLHQAVEAKEGVCIRNEQRTLATVTFQNYFRMYEKLSGMTGTAETEAEEFSKIYDLEVVVIPTHREMVRADFADLIYARQTGKWNAVIDEIAEEHEEGRPILVGTISVEVSEMLGGPAEAARDQAQRPQRQAPREGGRDRRPSWALRAPVTIATNMAGRGTDILLGGNPEVMAAESLHKKGTNVLDATPEEYAAALAEAERITPRTRRRCWRPAACTSSAPNATSRGASTTSCAAAPGARATRAAAASTCPSRTTSCAGSRTIRVQGIMRTLGFDDDTALESKMVSRTIESAQSRVEGYNFDTRKHVVEYDDVINRQRETIYRERDRILRSSDLGPTVEAMLEDEVAALVAEHTAGDHRDDWNLDGLKDAAERHGPVPGQCGPAGSSTKLASRRP